MTYPVGQRHCGQPQTHGVHVWVDSTTWAGGANVAQFQCAGNVVPMTRDAVEFMETARILAEPYNEKIAKLTDELAAARVEIERLLARTVCEACGMNHELMRNGNWSDTVGKYEDRVAERDAALAEVARLCEATEEARGIVERRVRPGNVRDRLLRTLSSAGRDEETGR